MSGFSIGSVRVPGILALGPMAGVTDRAFRILCREQGAALLYTEMVSAKAILFHNKKTAELYRTDPSEHPVGVQLFGNDPDIMSEAAAEIEEEPFDFFDINMGCPVPKVVNNKEGSALLLEPERAAAIVRAMKKKVRKPVTVKMRIGFSGRDINPAEFAKRLEDSGADLIAVHGRTRSQYYSGKADREAIRAVKNAVHVPVLGNGDVTDGRTAKQMLESTGTDGIMIARGARGNPWVFRRISAYLETGEELPEPTAEERCAMMLRHLDMLTLEKGSLAAVREMRKHIGWYSAGLHGASAFRGKVNRIEEKTELENVIREFFISQEIASRIL